MLWKYAFRNDKQIDDQWTIWIASRELHIIEQTKIDPRYFIMIIYPKVAGGESITGRNSGTRARVSIVRVYVRQ